MTDTALRQAVLYTVGHSDRPAAGLVAILTAAGIEHVADVRAHPGSRRHPQFNRQALSEALATAGIEYGWWGKALGGRRSSAGVSANAALTDPGLRAYADHMGTPVFREAVEELLAMGASHRVALLCAERLPEHCHRSLIADYLVLEGVEVVHLLSVEEHRRHEPDPRVRLAGERPVYDGQASGDLGLD